MARRDKESLPTPPDPQDESIVELDAEYEFAGQHYGPGKVKIESRPARRAILRALENAKEEQQAKTEEPAS